MPVLIQPYSGKEIEVHEDHAEFWRGLGYRDAEPETSDEDKTPPAKKAAAPKKSAESPSKEK